MTAQPLALVVDDEPQMIDIVSFALETQGFETVTARDAEKAWQIFKVRDLDLLVLDVMLPQASGLSLCRRIREVSSVPILLLTARGETKDRVEGLEAGADDYVTKPFHPRELALRAEAIVRRTRSQPAPGTLVYGPLQIAGSSASLNGRILNLTPTEFRLLVRLASEQGKPVSFRHLLLAGWQMEEGPGAKEMLKTAVYRLRLQLAEHGYQKAVGAVRGAGYQLTFTAPVPARPGTKAPSL
ncbi:response regulator [Arthrobacter sp. zg-Y750]|uniref:response regulator n=1 Tax=Arthrobacter sp. zg-Y750 TaxID=2894189 RepID=UPI001E32542A|nr:response regulator transcription factor [Arthrobacter sp. zg-Y750]MCC9177232.1 response regulator transcription factor [Arthrobacter sp. zg-Y750]